MSGKAMEFSGKAVLVTGAVTGIGRATAEAFLREGATVGVNHLDQSAEFAEMADALRSLPGKLIECEADVRVAAAVEGMVERLVRKAGRLDVLVNNAGISQVKPFLETTEEDWDAMIDTDLKSVFL
ncbi:MAG TPA: SDR family NAD(P)-dependent oxidoreductase, partial [Parvibaculum sp.]|nr:SDR family NAD(P)-dependent oxidoreductase [Parvibaculum sp.]